jgi:hypothetical protein
MKREEGERRRGGRIRTEPENPRNAGVLRLLGRRAAVHASPSSSSSESGSTVMEINKYQNLYN